MDDKTTEPASSFNKVVDAAANFLKDTFTQGSKLVQAVSEVSEKNKAAKKAAEASADSTKK